MLIYLTTLSKDSTTIMIKYYCLLEITNNNGTWLCHYKYKDL